MESLMTLNFRVDGEIYQTVSVEKDELIMPIDAPLKEGYRFVRWDNLPEKSVAGKELTVDAVYEKVSYRAVFVLDGEVLSEQSVLFGDPVVAPAVEAPKGMVFLGWKNLPETMPASDLEIVGETEPELFTFTFMVDDEVYAVREFAAGAPVEGVEDPVKEGYDFSGWNKNYKKMPHSNLTVRGYLTPHVHTVVFEIDGEMKFRRTLPYGADIRPIGIPTRPNHSFNGWDSIPEKMPDEDLEFHGHFTINQRTLRFMLEDRLIFETVLNAGAPVKAPEVEAKDGFMFSGWRGLPKKMPDCDYTAEGRYYVKKFKVSYMVDGEEVSSQSVPFGAPIPPVSAPEKEGKIFSGWQNLPETMPADDVVVVAEFLN